MASPVVAASVPGRTSEQLWRQIVRRDGLDRIVSSSTTCDSATRMRVLVLSQYYAPELTAGAWRVSTFCRRLAATGAEVEVICEIPNHPRGVVEEGYGRKPFDRRRVEGVRVNYAWVPARPVKTTRNRVAGYGVYAVMATIAGALARRPDVVLLPRLHYLSASQRASLHGATGGPGSWTSATFGLRRRLPSVSCVETELVALATRLEHRLYHSADAIATRASVLATRSSRAACRRRGSTTCRQGQAREWLDLGRRVVDREPLDLPRDRFIWTYAGNLGLAQGLDTAIRAAARLGPEYQLLVVGDGPLRSQLETLARGLATGSVRFTGLVPVATAGEYIARVRRAPRTAC